MRILKISDVYFPRVNGVSTSIETFRRDLAALGHEVVLVAPSYSGGGADPLETADPSIRRVAARAVPRDPEDRIMSWGGLRRALGELARNKFDVVHIHTPFLAHYAGIEFARAQGTPVVATYHTLFEEYLHHYVPLLPRRITGAVARRFSRSQCNQLDAVIAPSQAMRQALLAYGIHKRIEILPTGLPADRFQAGDGAAFRRRHGLKQEQPLLLFVGRTAHEKNIGFLLGMMLELRKRRPDALLLIAGEGPAAPSLRAQATRLGLDGSVHFLGYFDRHGELQDCYSAADIFVFSSLTETQGLVLLEAMAQGVPVVAIPRMGTIDILGPGLGCRQAPEDREGFAQVVYDLLADAGARSALGAQAREYAHTWASIRMAQRLSALYASLARPNTPAGPSTEARTGAVGGTPPGPGPPP
jgi:1,2-diacylglycerol 3-alpha-glucosyltransferase